MTQIASVYGTCIQWHLYETVRIWRLRVPLGIGRNLFRLTFPLWALCAVNSPRFHPLYKAPWEDYLPNLLPLESYRSSKFFHFLEQKMPPESWALQLKQRKQRLKILLFFNQTRKSTFLLRLGIVASTDRVRSLIILQTPTKNVQELATKEGEESEAKLRGAIEISEFASGQPQQVETNSSAPASFSSSPPEPSTRAWWLLERDCESTITTSLLPFIS